MNTRRDYNEASRSFQEHLTEIAAQSDIVGAVALEALKYDQPEYFFYDLLQYGCVCGMVDGLVWYSETHAFYDHHYAEIEELREDFEESVGEPLKIKGDLKNFLAWFAFEEVAYRLASEWRLT